MKTTKFPKDDFGVIVKNQNGNEIIEYLENKGFKNSHRWTGSSCDNYFYFIGKSANLILLSPKNNNPTSTSYTLEELKAIDSEELILPEKWCITTTEESQDEIFDWLEKNTNWNSKNISIDLTIGNHYCINKNICTAWMYFAPERKKGYTEITFEQFQKYVLKEEADTNWTPQAGDWVITKNYCSEYDGRALLIKNIINKKFCYFEVEDGGKYDSKDNFSINCVIRKAEPHEISKTEFKIPEYVEYIDTIHKGQIVKVEDWCCESYCKVIFSNRNKEQPFKHLVKPSTKEAYYIQEYQDFEWFIPRNPRNNYNIENSYSDVIREFLLTKEESFSSKIESIDSISIKLKSKTKTKQLKLN